MKAEPERGRAAPSPTPLDPRGVYESLRVRRSAEAARLDRLDAAIAGARLVTFVLAAVVAWLVLVSGWLTPAWLLPPVTVFVGLVIVHSRVIRRLTAARRAVALWEEGLRRIDDAWAGRGITGAHLAPPGHLYAEDLDLFGAGTLFERLCLARTGAGEETLARWLTEPAASADEVRRRQAAVVELRDDLDLRERLALAGEDVRLGVNAAALRAWAAWENAWMPRGAISF